MPKSPTRTTSATKTARKKRPERPTARPRATAERKPRTPAEPAPLPKEAVTVEKTVTILRPAAEVLAAFRDPSLVPRFVHDVRESEIVVDRRGDRIHWQSLEDGEVLAAGSVDLRPAPGDRGTEVKVRFSYPSGRAGRAVSKLLGKDPRQQITRDLYRLRQVLEAGVITTTEGQPSGRKS
jgi:uncharacterized membrane protein